MRRLLLISLLVIAGGLLAFARERQRTLKVDVDLVQVYATVTDESAHYVVGLDAENFEIYEDKVAQDIQSFSAEDVPLSAGILLDVSGSVKSNLIVARDAAVAFLKSGNPEDEYFLVEFNDRAQLTQDFTADIANLQYHIAFTPAKGATALFDALYLGLSRVRTGSNPRKCLLVMTDGGENNSHYNLSQVRDLAREQDVQVYWVQIAGDAGIQNIATLGDLVEMTGGQQFFAGSRDAVERICMRISLDLRNQYVLGYHSSNRDRDGKYRHIRLKVNPPKAMGKLFVRAKEGYYAPMN